MTKPFRFLLLFVTVLMLLSVPFLIPSGAVLGDLYAAMEEEMYLNEDTWSSLRRWGAVALAEEEGGETLAPGKTESEEDTGSSGEEQPSAEEPAVHYQLPADFSAGLQPNPAGYTETGYQDDSITVTLETRQQEDTVFRIAYVTIQDASQLRTAIAGAKVTSTKVAKPSKIAADHNAVIAISGDFYTNDTNKTTFEYRMGERIRAKRNNAKDALVIDQNGDFHLYAPLTDANLEAIRTADYTIINAFTFGPALVIDGQLADLRSGYGYNPNGREPRMAIGQIGKLQYVLVLAEGRNGKSDGATHQELANMMFDLGCMQAFNLDGGNTATMIFNGGYYQDGRSEKNERPQSDIIYFATAVDPATWSE